MGKEEEKKMMMMTMINNNSNPNKKAFGVRCRDACHVPSATTWRFPLPLTEHFLSDEEGLSYSDFPVDRGSGFAWHSDCRQQTSRGSPGR